MHHTYMFRVVKTSIDNKWGLAKGQFRRPRGPEFAHAALMQHESILISTYDIDTSQIIFSEATYYVEQ